MKKNLFTFLFAILLGSSFGQTNVYHKFPEHFAEWKGTFSGYQAPQCYKFTYNINDFDYFFFDTSFYRNISLNRVIYYHDITGMCDFSSFWASNSWIPGAIREDTISRKVYFLETDSLHEKLLYDFSLNVGDTVKTYITTLCSGAVVTQIDSILIDGNYRKQWTVESPGCLFSGQGKIIEGIGSTMGLLEQMVNFEWWGTLECFSQDFVNMYSIDNINCPIVTTILNSKKGINNFSIFPNPAKNSITISQTEPTFNKYEIYSLNGKLISENKIQNILQTIDLSGYSEGMYIVKLIGAQKVEFKKIVVVE